VNGSSARLRDVYLRAIEIRDTDQQQQFVSSACGEDIALFDQVVHLLRLGDVDDCFLAGPAVSVFSAADLSGLLPEEPLCAGIVIERYQLLQLIGSGGMGTVFQAKQLEPVERVVALKVLRSGFLTAASAAQLQAERQALASLKHPGIVSVLDAGSLPDGRPWFAMNYVDGLPLTTFCRDRNFSLHDSLRLISELCDAVSHAHFRGIIHRDLKPSNVLVESLDGRPVCRLIDFGICRDTLTAPEQPHITAGTPDYMSPEQCCVESRAVDTRSDVFSIGRILSEVVYGSPLSVEAGVPVAGSGLRMSARLNREVSSIIRRATASYPDDRYAGVGALRDELQRVLEGHAVEAMPQSGLYRLERFCSRHRLPVLLALLTVFSLVLGVLISLRQTYVARASERRAEYYLGDAQSQQRKFQDLALVSTLRQAWTAWELRNLFETDRLLNVVNTLGAAAETSAEWRILKAQLQSTLSSRKICEAAIHELRPIRGGNLVVAACGDGTLRFLRSDTGAVEFEVSSGIESLHAVAVNSSGRFIAVGGSTDKVSDRSFVRIYDTEERTWRNASPPMLTTIEMLAFSDDGNTLLCGSRYESPIVLSTDTCTIAATLPVERRNLWGAISADGSRVLVAAADNRVYLADLTMQTGRGIAASEIGFSPHQHVLTGFPMPPTGRLCCVIDDTDSLILQDVESRQALASLEFQGKPLCVHSGISGSQMVSSSVSGEVVSWDLSSLNSVEPMRKRPGEQTFREVGTDRVPFLQSTARWIVTDKPLISLCAADDTILSATETGDIHAVTLTPTKLKQLEFQTAEQTWTRPNHIEVSLDRRSVLIGFSDGELIRLEPLSLSESNASGDSSVCFPEQHRISAVLTAATPAGQASGCAIASERRPPVKLIPMHDGQLWLQRTLGTGSQSVSEGDSMAEQSIRCERAVPSPDGRRFAYCADRTISLVQSATLNGKGLTATLPGLIHAFCWHPDGRSLIMGGEFGGLWQWFPETGETAALPGPVDQVRQLAVSATESTLVTGDRGGRVTCWSLEGERPRYRAGSQRHHGEIYAICLIDHGRLAVSVDEKLQVEIWRTSTATQVGRLGSLPGECMHGQDVLRLYTTPDGARLILVWLRTAQSVYWASWNLK
jgi:WD40 repeat protein